MSATLTKMVRSPGGTWLAVWVLTLGVLSVAIIPPERCSYPTVVAVDDAATAAAGWIVANQYENDRWRYEFDRDSATDLPGYNIVRHAGLMTALYQRHAWVGDEAAFESAERGLDWIDPELFVAGDGVAVRDGDSGTTGGSALLAAALVFRRDATGATDRDPLIAALARFLVGQQLENGSISARFDLRTGEPVLDEFSPFSTGEAMWALAMAGDRLGVQAWRDVARKTLDYVALERDDTEREFPPNDDHWTGYAIAELVTDGLDDHHRDYVRRLAGLWSAEVRFDSQRTGEGINRLVRGGVGRSGVQGTNLEGMSALWRTAMIDDGLADIRDDLTERIGCAADMLARRQVTDGEAAAEPIPDATAGAWFRDGLTRMDTQQHALAGLTGAGAVLTATDPAAGSSEVDLLELVAAAALLAALVTARRRSDAVVDPRWMLGATAALVVSALVGPFILDAVDVSATSARMAVGVLIVAVLVAGWTGREARPWPSAAIYPPAVVSAAVLAADLGRMAAVVAAVMGLAVAHHLHLLRRRDIADLLVVRGRESLLILAAAATVIAGAIGL